jgi:hypothetical protein
MKVMIEKMQKEYDEMRMLLGILQDEEPTTEQRGVGRPRKHMATGKSGWSDDPEQRKLEMQRRFKVREEKRAKKLSPRDKAHPDHAKWIEKMTRQRKREWAAMSPQKRRERLAAMAAGRAKKSKKPLVKLQAKTNQEAVA